MFTEDVKGIDGPGPATTPQQDTPQEVLADALAAKERGDLKAHGELLTKATEHYRRENPEPTQPGVKGDGQPQEGESPLKVSVPLTPVQETIADAYAADVSDVVKGLNLDHGQVATFFDFTVAGALQDVAGVTDPDACITVLRTRHGPETDALVDDAKRAVASLGSQVKDYLENTGAGNSPSVLESLALWHRGHFKLTPEQARQRLQAGKVSPLEARLLHMLAVRGET
jgi:hypothetical protein